MTTIDFEYVTVGGESFNADLFNAAVQGMVDEVQSVANTVVTNTAGIATGVTALATHVTNGHDRMLVTAGSPPVANGAAYVAQQMKVKLLSISASTVALTGFTGVSMAFRQNAANDALVTALSTTSITVTGTGTISVMILGW